MSIHGIGFIFDRRLGAIDRLLWTILFIGFFTVASVLTWKQWQNNQVMNTWKHTAIAFDPVSKLAMPTLKSENSYTVECPVCFKAVTTLKEKSKPVTDLPFPAVTICSSGLHMSNVEKKIGQNFAQWRVENNRTDHENEAIERDIKEYMWTSFQIQSEEETGTKPVNTFLTCLTLWSPLRWIIPRGIRENVFSCKKNCTNRQPVICCC